MKPHYFSSGGDSAFGVYHPAMGATGAQSPNAVVLCPPIGQEGIRAHKCLLSLAKRLAKNGTHVLRFAYRGFDDSSLWSDEISSLRDWQSDIAAAKEQLKRLCGCSTVMLIGLRLGANLAARVAAVSEDVHSVVLWEPIENGYQYIENLRSNQKEMIDLWHRKQTTTDTEEIEELFSTRYQRCLLAEIEQVGSETVGLLQPTLIVSARANSNQTQPSSFIQDSPAMSRDSMEKRTESNEPDGWRELEHLEEVWWRPQSVNHVVAEVQEMFRRIQSYGWYRQPAHANRSLNVAAGDALWEFDRLNEMISNDHSEDRSGVREPADLKLASNSNFRESVVSFCDGSNLTGILTEPSHPNKNKPVVILLNAGIVHRVGPFRLHVHLARVLARQGFSSFRIDLSGLGDSGPRTGKLSKDERVRKDVAQAMDRLQGEGFSGQFVLLGLCSGAYHAHQVAVCDPRVLGAVFLDGIVYRTVGFYFRHHLMRLFNPRFWRNAIKRRWLNAMRKNGESFQEEGNKFAEAEYFQMDQSPQAIALDLLELKRRENQMLFIYTGDYDDICGRQQFAEMYGIIPDDQIQVDYMAAASHTFRIANHRDQLCQRIASWMKERFN